MTKVAQLFRYEPSLYSGIKSEFSAVEDALDSCRMKIVSASTLLQNQRGLGVEDIAYGIENLGKRVGQLKGNAGQIRAAWRDIHDIATGAESNAYRVVKSDGKNLLDQIVKAVWDLTTEPIRLGIGAVKYTADVVISAYKAFQPGGSLYVPWLYVKSAVKVVLGLAKMVGGIAAIPETGGASLLVALYGAFDIVDGVADLKYTYTGQYDQVGKNEVVKEGLEAWAGNIGKALGNEKMGETIGGMVYDGGELTSDVISFGVSAGDFETMPVHQDYFFGKVSSEFNSLPSDLWTLGNTEIADLPYQFKLFTYATSELSQFSADMKTVYGFFSDGKDLIVNFNTLAEDLAQ